MQSRRRKAGGKADCIGVNKMHLMANKSYNKYVCYMVKHNYGREKNEIHIKNKRGKTITRGQRIKLMAQLISQRQRRERTVKKVRSSRR